MPEYSMSDFLQGRSPMRQSLQDVYQRMLRDGEMEPSDLGRLMPPPTLGGNIAMRQPSAPTITHGKGSVQPIPTREALGQHNVLSRLLSSVGQPSYDMMMRDMAEMRRTGELPQRDFRGQLEMVQTLPILPGATRAPSRAALPPTRAPMPTPTGPWQPGYMSNWLEGRYQPAARPQAGQADRRFGTVDRPGFHWTDVPAGRLNRFDFSDPLNRSQLLELGKGAGAAGAAGGVGGAAGMYVTDTLVHGEPWQTASWRALVGPTAGDPPSWWPQPPPDERPPPPGGPQPPSRLRSGWLPSTAQPPER